MSSPAPSERAVRILLLNPNSSTAMTDGMEAAAKKLILPDYIDISTYTASSSSPASINDNNDINASTEVVLSDKNVMKSIEDGAYDAVLVACFSVHTLVPKLSEHKNLAVTGIFEASILTSLSIIGDPSGSEKWGVVTTGKFWEDHLAHGVNQFIGQNKGDENSKFAGVFSSGLTAGDFHTLPPEEVKAKLKAATKKLLQTGSVKCVAMGCGGMAGLEEIIRETAVEVYGEQEAANVFIIDGVKAGILQLEQTVRSRRAFQSGI
ncbi:hypothetical protein NLU13_5800 [Sarocladium strictum]|uniref:Hydantoin racemase n=1 Tax=Sarocladium strictum TaxID=5046 RepID=A0AA39GHL9_SARSR|nr:hypothetical protein NLU13_5800 [Sarocladium strictum]